MSLKEQQIDALKTANDYLERLLPGVENTVQLFRQGNEAEAIEWMTNIIDGLKWVCDVFTLTKDIVKEEIQIEEMNQYLNEIIEALENTDYILLADLLQYEITPILINWKEALSIMAQSNFEQH